MGQVVMHNTVPVPRLMLVTLQSLPKAFFPGTPVAGRLGQESDPL